MRVRLNIKYEVGSCKGANSECLIEIGHNLSGKKDITCLEDIEGS